jgi:serine/threonine protein kinase
MQLLLSTCHHAMPLQGTLVFYSPEMCEGDGFNGFAADAWALGVCLWVFCFSTLPYYHTDPVELFDMIALEPLSFPAACQDDAPLQDLLAGLLNKDPVVRLTLEEAQDHTWLKRQLLPSQLKRAESYQISLSECDVQAAISTKHGYKLVTAPVEALAGFGRDGVAIVTSAFKAVKRIAGADGHEAHTGADGASLYDNSTASTVVAAGGSSYELSVSHRTQMLDSLSHEDSTYEMIGAGIAPAYDPVPARRRRGSSMHGGSGGSSDSADGTSRSWGGRSTGTSSMSVSTGGCGCSIM